MFDFHEWRKIKNVLYSKVTLVALAVVVLLLLNSVWNIYFKERETRLTRKKLESELQELQGRETQLRGEIERLTSERGIEEEIRGIFEVAKEGEDVMVIVDPQKEDDDEYAGTQKGFWSKLFDLFF